MVRFSGILNKDPHGSGANSSKCGYRVSLISISGFSSPLEPLHVPLGNALDVQGVKWRPYFPALDLMTSGG